MDTMLAQTDQDFEIVLIDDGSTDASPALCDGYAAEHPGFIRVVHKPNGGLSSARNAGIDAAKGEFIIFPDPASIRSAMDHMIRCIEDNLCPDGMVSYSAGKTSNRRYVDTLGFVCPFLALYGRIYQEPRYVRMAVEQLRLFRRTGLLSNFLSMLSLTELGIGSAIIFALYKPVSVNDEEKIASLMRIYKYAYRLIGTIIAVLGICMIPFLQFVIGETPEIRENFYLIYGIYLFNAVFK